MNEAQVTAMHEELLSLYAQTFAVTAQAFEKLAAFEREGCAAYMMYQSTAHYLNVAAGIALGTGREHVRIAVALENLPLTKAAFAKGSISFSKVRALTRLATTETEAELLSTANLTTASQLEKIVRGCRRITTEEAARQSMLRAADYGFDEDGMFYLKVRLLPDEGARFSAAIEKAMPKPSKADRRDVQERRADGVMALLAGDVPAEVVLHVEDDSYQVATQRAGMVACSKETARRVSCDASVVTMAHDKDGNVLDIGRKSRRVPAGMRRALAHRDGGCQYPGCPNTLVDAHHIEHWQDGGETKLSNLTLLCRYHHMRLHEGGYRIVAAEDGRLTFISPHGTALVAALPLPAPAVVQTATERWQGVDWTNREIDYSLLTSMLAPTLIAAGNARTIPAPR